MKVLIKISELLLLRTIFFNHGGVAGEGRGGCERLSHCLMQMNHIASSSFFIITTAATFVIKIWFSVWFIFVRMQLR